MKSGSGNTHQNKKTGGNLTASSNMNRQMSKGVVYQQKYRKKLKKQTKSMQNLWNTRQSKPPGLFRNFSQKKR